MGIDGLLKNLKEPKFTLGLYLGVGLFIVLIITIAASGGFSLPENSGGWLYEYQTAFTGLVGLITALIIGYQYKDTVKRKRLSQRVYMNDALSGLCSYSEQCFNAIFGFFK